MVQTSNIWNQTKNLLIVYVYKNQEDFDQFKVMIYDTIENSNVKELKVFVLTSTNKKEIVKYSLFNYFSENDISIFGKIKKKNNIIGDDNLEGLKKSHFDTLISFGTPSVKVLKWMKDFSIKNRVSVNCENKTFFQLNLKNQSDSIGEMINFTVSTLKKIG